MGMGKEEAHETRMKEEVRRVGRGKEEIVGVGKEEVCGDGGRRRHVGVGGCKRRHIGKKEDAWGVEDRIQRHMEGGIV